MWTYGIQLWGSAKNSNIEILERFQNKMLRIITGTPWYVPNKIIKDDLHILNVKDEIKKHGLRYMDRLEKHPNRLAKKLEERNDM